MEKIPCVCGHASQGHMVECVAQPTKTSNAVFRLGPCRTCECDRYSEPVGMPDAPNPEFVEFKNFVRGALRRWGVQGQSETTIENISKDILGNLPLGSVNLSRIWKAGERVENVSGGYGGAAKVLRPGTVLEVRSVPVRHEHLWVHFDDGETRSINPDVMRHIKEDKA